MATIDQYQDVLDVRDIIARVEELRELQDNSGDVPTRAGSDEEFSELQELESLLAELAGNGGDEQWEGDWYPLTLIRDCYFKDYAQELADDIGAIDRNASWPCTCIDWEKAARELRMDYSSVEFRGIDYWYR